MKKVRIKVKRQSVWFPILRYFFYIEMFYNQEQRFGLPEDIEVLETF